MKSEKRQAANSVLWSAVERFSVQGIQFVLGIVIARLLLPSDYGLVAMLAIFMAVAQTFVDSGFANALIQKNGRTEVDYSTVFYFNIAIAFVLYLLLYLTAPAIADFYHQEQLVVLTRWLGLNVVISAFSIVQRAKLTIKVDFKTQAKASVWAVCISGAMGLTAAYYGYGVWALVIQSISNNLLNTLLLCLFSRWFPSRVFSWMAFRELFSFGSKLLASGLLHTIYINLYSLVIGRFYNAADVGYYNRAYSLAQFPSINITTVITRVVYPLQCRIQDDKKQLEASFAYYLRLSCFVVFPLMIMLCVLAKPLVITLLTDKWLFAAPLLSILCVAYMWYPILVINNNILNVKGRSDYFLKAEIIKKTVSLAILAATIPFGVEVLCWGLLLYNLLDFFIIVFFSRRVISTSHFAQIKSMLPILTLSASMGGVMYLCVSLLQNNILQIVVGGVVGVFYFVLVGRLFRFAEILFLESWIKSKLIKKSRS